KSPHVSKYDHSHIARSSVVRKTTDDLPVQPTPPAVHGVVQHTPTPNNAQHSHQQSSSATIEAALHNAHSHEQVHHHTKKRRKSLAKRFGISSKTAALSS